MFQHLVIIWLFPLLVGASSPPISVEELMNQIVQNQSNDTKPDVLFEYNKVNLNSTRTPLNLINYFPADFLDPYLRHNGGFVLHIIIFAYLCFVMAVVIDSYFLQSLQYFCSVLNIPPNISGCTFMALGTSSPEFFSSAISVFMGESTIGTGAIVGSSIFNILAIPGICGLTVFLFRIPMLKMRYWSIGRDIIFYSITIIIFVLSIKDNSVDWLESWIFLFIYIIYIFSLYVWSKFEIVNEKIQQKTLRRSRSNFFSKYNLYLRRNSLEKGQNFELEEMNQQLREMANFIVDTGCIYSILFPFILLMKVTIPKPNSQCFVVTFIMSTLWIAGLTYVILWMVSLIGDTFNLPNAIAGMTILTVGNNIPELIASFILIKKFQLVDMAICHIIGSNIFNILICLGLSWSLKILALTITTGSNLEELQNYIIPLDQDMTFFVTGCLVLSLLLFIIIFRWHKYQLSGGSGFIYLICYTGFIVFILTYKTNFK